MHSVCAMNQILSLLGIFFNAFAMPHERVQQYFSYVKNRKKFMMNHAIKISILLAIGHIKFYESVLYFLSW